MIEEKKNKLSKVTVKIDFNLAPGLNSLENVIEEFSDNFVTAFKIEAEKRAKLKMPLK